MQLELGRPTYEDLARLICGNDAPSPYRSGPQLVEFFNVLGFDHSYGPGFPSRQTYCLDSLKECDNDQLLKAVMIAVDPRHYLEVEGGAQPAVDFLNKRLHFDDLELVPSGKGYKLVRRQTGALLALDAQDADLDAHSLSRIDENFEKARHKLAQGDYSGAITNARTLLESVIGGIERRLKIDSGDEKLPARFSRVRKALESEVDDAAARILKGLGSVLQGIAEGRNSLSDSHEGDREPFPYEARLFVESASAIAAFLVAVLPKPKE